MNPKLTALGLCGVDDSIHPHQIAILSYTYPLVEFGVLFRPDKAGTPRYASTEWIEQLCAATQYMKQSIGHTMKLAAHLCSSRVIDVLNGNGIEFLQYLVTLGFQRVQINATAVNGVDTTNLAISVPYLWQMIQQFNTKLEFIIQKNVETKPLWEPIEELLHANPSTANVSMLLDESQGTGVVTSSTSWTIPSELYQTGYAGGIGPNNIREILLDITKHLQDGVGDGNELGATTVPLTDQQNIFWIDMESSLRSTKNGKDVFDLDKCFQVIDAVCTLNLMDRPNYLNGPSD
jgi:phosphoribosylanthranilate isomerase